MSSKSKYQKIFDSLEKLGADEKVKIKGSQKEINIVEKSVRLFITKKHRGKFIIRKPSEKNLKIIWRKDVADNHRKN